MRKWILAFAPFVLAASAQAAFVQFDFTSLAHDKIPGQCLLTGQVRLYKLPSILSLNGEGEHQGK